MPRDILYRIHPLGICTREEEQALGHRIRAGDDAARAELIERNIPLVIRLATRHVKQRHGLTLDDVIQEGIIGLMRAVEDFDPARGVRFSTYATWWIQLSMRRHFESVVWVPVHAWAKLASEKRAEAARSSEESAPATAKKGKPKFGPFIAAATRQTAAVEDDARTAPAEDHGGRLDLAADLVRLDEALSRMAPRHCEVLARRLGLDGLEAGTLLSVGADMRISGEWVRRIEREAMATLARLLGQDERAQALDDAIWRDGEHKRAVLNARERAVRARKRLAAGVAK